MSGRISINRDLIRAAHEELPSTPLEIQEKEIKKIKNEQNKPASDEKKQSFWDAYKWYIIIIVAIIIIFLIIYFIFIYQSVPVTPPILPQNTHPPPKPQPPITPKPQQQQQHQYPTEDQIKREQIQKSLDTINKKNMLKPEIENAEAEVSIPKSKKTTKRRIPKEEVEATEIEDVDNIMDQETMATAIQTKKIRKFAKLVNSIDQIMQQIKLPRYAIEKVLGKRYAKEKIIEVE